MFTHLHVHTEYSLLDGCCRIQQLVHRAKELGMRSLAITDHGNMYGIIDFYMAARDAGIKPIIGCELYVASSDYLKKGPADKTNSHLTLLAQNQEGYRNLIKLVTHANMEGYYYKPRIDKQLLSRYKEGLIVLSGCVQGELGRLLRDGRYEEALQSASWYKKEIKHYYIEIQRHPIPEIEQINEGLLKIAAELDIPLVATNDVHYINKEDDTIHDILLCIGTNSTVSSENRLKMAGPYFYLKTEEEMRQLYADIPSALENTNVIADLCNVEIEFGKPHLPKVEIPDGKDAWSHLSGLCWRGFKEKFPPDDEEAKQRLEYELDVIKKTQFADYFLVVHDLVSFVRKKQIFFGVRGSAAASLALYCLSITDINPLTYKLIFERFLNIERKEMPDIDLDFQDDRREEVIAYVNEKYGAGHVAQIITFGTLGARGSVKDVGRVLGLNYGSVDQVTRLIPSRPNIKLDDALSEVRELKDIYEKDETIRNLIDTSRKLEGISRHSSTHAAGVVISGDVLTEYLPLQRSGKGEDQSAMTQFTMENVARLGLLKMDFLGLANLTLLAKAKEEILKQHNIVFNLLDIPLDDEKTFALLSAGETTGIFQLESTGMRRYIKELKPTKFTDISAMVALYRPGPMDFIPTFIKAKHGKDSVHYPHDDLRPILEDTYGVIVYQDQVLFIVQRFAGYSLGRADIIRKAMGKKNAEVMRKEKLNFVEGAQKKGYTEEEANTIFSLIEPFAGYAFNKAHSVSYARIAYETAFLKANYPFEYLTAFLNTYYEKTDRMITAIAECRRMGIPIKGPDVNHSEAIFTIEKSDSVKNIRFGLSAIKNVGSSAVQPIIAARMRDGEFKSLSDFCRRVDLRTLNRKVMESLVKAGAFDCLANRGQLLSNLDRILSLSQREQKQKETGQSSMFDMFGENVDVPLPSLDLSGEDATLQEKLVWEKELMGVYFSEHPLSAIASKLAEHSSVMCGEISNELAGERVRIGGLLTSVRHVSTKNNRTFVIAVLEDLNGSIEVTVWSDVYSQTQSLWVEGNILLIDGSVKIREDTASINCSKVSLYNPETSPEMEKQGKSNNKSSISKPLTIDIKQTDNSEKDIAHLQQLIDLLRAYPGPRPVQLIIHLENKKTRLDITEIKVDSSTGLIQDLSRLLGYQINVD